MSDKNKEVSTADEKLSKPSDGVQKTGVISDKDNSREFHKAHTKSHQNDKRPSELEMPAVQSFGIDGLHENEQPRATRRTADTSWTKEGDNIDIGATWQAVAGTESEKAVLARRHFLRLLDSNEHNATEKQQVIDAMHKFEKRHSTNPKEIKEFYDQCSRMFDKNWMDGMKPVPQEKRVTLAEQVILQAANPDLIRQGDHNTCNVTTVEYRMYSKHPSAAAKMVADLSLDASWKSGSTHVDLNMYRDCFKPEKGTDSLKLGDDRSFASQIFQIGAVNVHYAGHGNTVYYQERNEKTDKQEEVLDEGNFKGRKPNLSDDELIAIYNKIANTNDDKFIFTHDSNPATQHCERFKSKDELRNFLFRHQEDMPITLVVDVINEPIWSENNGVSYVNGPHVVTIKSFDPIKNTVDLHNQWTAKNDHKDMPLEVLYNSSLPIGASMDRLTELKDSGKISVNERLDLARMEWVFRPPSDPNSKLANDLITCMKDAQHRWKTQHTSVDQQQRDWVKYDRIIELLSDKNGIDPALLARIRKEVGR